VEALPGILNPMYIYEALNLAHSILVTYLVRFKNCDGLLISCHRDGDLHCSDCHNAYVRPVNATSFVTVQISKLFSVAPLVS
jgi:hypothetical protein